MQTEETTEQRAQRLGDQVAEDVTARHWHLVTEADGHKGLNMVYTEGAEGMVRQLRPVLGLCFDQATRELAMLTTKHKGDHARIGAAFARTSALDDLKDLFDPKLFEHPLFGQPATMDCLEEAIEIAVDCLEKFQVTEKIFMRVYFCEDPECPELAEAKAEEGDECPGCGKVHKRRAGAIVMDSEGNQVGEFDLPFPRSETTFGEMQDSLSKGLREMLADSGIEAEEIRVASAGADPTE